MWLIIGGVSLIWGLVSECVLYEKKPLALSDGRQALVQEHDPKVFTKRPVIEVKP